MTDFNEMLTEEDVRKMVQNILRRAQLCLDCDGDTFEHLVKKKSVQQNGDSSSSDDSSDNGEESEDLEEDDDEESEDLVEEDDDEDITSSITSSIEITATTGWAKSQVLFFSPKKN